MMSLKKSGFNRYEPPPPSLDGDEEIEETFLQDVDKFHDELPQPFRKIDKIIWEMFEQSWIIIGKKEEERSYKKSSELTLSKILYEEELVLNIKVTCIAACDKYCLIGSNNEIIVYEMPSLMKITSYDWSEIATDCFIKELLIFSHYDDVLLLVAVDTEGVLKILGFKTDKFYLIQQFEHKTESETLIAEKITLAEDNSFLAVSWTDGTNQWLDLYTLPSEEWLGHLEKVKPSKSSCTEAGEESLENSSETGGDVDNNTSQSQIVEQDLELSSPFTFPQVQQILRVNPPQIKACNNSPNISTVLKSLDIDSNVLCSGNHHILTTTFFEHLHNEFKIKAKWTGDDDLYKRTPTVATSHFLKGQMTSSLFPSRNSLDEDGSYNAVAVCWKDCNQVYLYPLKPAKDLEQPPLSILPHASNIVWSAVNAQTDLIAVSLMNNCISVWNRYIGQPLKVFMSVEQQAVTMLRFSSVYHGTLETRLTYATSNGKLYQMTCERNDMTNPVLLDNRSSTMFAHDQVSKVVDGPKNLLTIIWQSGQIIIYNEASSQALCQLDLLAEDNTNHTTGGNSLNLTYSKSFIFAVRDESQDCNKSTRLFLFEPDVYPILQPFFHFMFIMNEEEEEKVDNLEKNFLRFLRRRKLSDESLQARIATQRRELMVHS